MPDTIGMYAKPYNDMRDELYVQAVFNWNTVSWMMQTMCLKCLWLSVCTL